MSEYRIGNQFLWDPVKNLEIGLEVFYAHIDQTLAHNPGVAATALPAGISRTRMPSKLVSARARLLNQPASSRNARRSGPPGFLCMRDTLTMR